MCKWRGVWAIRERLPGEVMDLVTSAQMRSIERRAIESGAVTGSTLMERAGQGVVEATLRHWPALAEAPAGAVALVLCGPGNNGGDGFVIARLLAERGIFPRVLLHAESPRFPPDALEMQNKWREMGEVSWLSALYDLLRGEPPALIVDALLGTGLTREVTGPIAWALYELAEACEGPWRGVPVVAVDVPSGLCADTGEDRGPIVPADLCVAFHCAKPGHFLSKGPDFCGALTVCDIGLPPVNEGAVPMVAAPDPALLRKGGGHKYDHGHALVLSGGVGRGGAARMAARAALRIGAGLVTLGVPPPALQENAARLDAVMLRRVGDAPALAELLADARFSALCLGPGLGLDRAPTLVTEALAAGRPCLLDADALSAFAEVPEALFTALTPDCVLTPHDGEFRRLFPDLSERMAAKEAPFFSRIDAAQAAAARAGCVVLLKGRDTVIAAPDGRVALHAAAYERPAPWLATAGAGDVLAGMICGLLARGVPAFDAACAGAWLHVDCARQVGPGLIAEDLPEALPGVLRRLLG
ncbi:NAD(P)H-hydrate dehydratase [Cereibacter sphaeroides]|nr:NAD(P)H-hydrate dehydratase [Cereibacter sphaeroides]